MSRQGFEPWTLGLKVRCSTRLSYRPVYRLAQGLERVRKANRSPISPRTILSPARPKDLVDSSGCRSVTLPPVGGGRNPALETAVARLLTLQAAKAAGAGNIFSLELALASAEAAGMFRAVFQAGQPPTLEST